MNPALYKSEHPRLLKAAMIGCGSHAVRNILPAIQFAPVDLVAVCDLDSQRAQQAARQFGAPSCYSDLALMLAKEQPEVVFTVLNYDRSRPRYPAVAVQAMRAGAHVWIEKPPASSADQVLLMMQASHETGRFVGVGFKKMFAPANVKAKELISRPEFGSVATITARYPQSLPPIVDRDDDSKMLGFLDHLFHPFSVLRLLGGPIKSILVQREESQGSSLTLIRYASGAIGSLHLCAGLSEMAPKERTEIVGAGGNVVVDNNIRVTYYRQSPSPGQYGRTPSFYANDATAPLFWEPEFSLGQLYNKGLFLLGYAPKILSFCSDIIANTPPAVGSLADALELTLIYESYRNSPDSRWTDILVPH